MFCNIPIIFIFCSFSFLIEIVSIFPLFNQFVCDPGRLVVLDVSLDILFCLGLSKVPISEVS